MGILVVLNVWDWDRIIRENKGQLDTNSGFYIVTGSCDLAKTRVDKYSGVR
jgi:hypothetical protein